MAESIITMEMKEIKNFEWSSILDLTGKGLDQFNAVGKDMNCTQLMRNAGLDWQVDLKPVQFTDKGNFVNEIVTTQCKMKVLQNLVTILRNKLILNLNIALVMIVASMLHF
jgi:autotransporter translocation and assembly factor TamB